MILLSLVKCAGSGDLGHDRTPKLTRLARRLHGFLRHSLIGVVMIKNRRAILRANVRTLPVERGRIVRFPKHRQHFFEGLIMLILILTLILTRILILVLIPTLLLTLRLALILILVLMLTLIIILSQPHPVHRITEP